MKEITFVRHAKSDWGTEFLKDIDRPLAERGYNDAYMMSEWIAKNKKVPERLIASPAIRAYSTALIFARTFERDPASIELEKKIYESPASRLISIIKATDDACQSIMLFGHNPGFTDVCNELSDDLFFDNVPTCGVVSLSFGVKSWSEIEPKGGKINYYQYPKNFRNTI